MGLDKKEHKILQNLQLFKFLFQFSIKKIIGVGRSVFINYSTCFFKHREPIAWIHHVHSPMHLNLYVLRAYGNAAWFNKKQRHDHLFNFYKFRSFISITIISVIKLQHRNTHCIHVRYGNKHWSHTTLFDAITLCLWWPLHFCGFD